MEHDKTKKFSLATLKVMMKPDYDTSPDQSYLTYNKNTSSSVLIKSSTHIIKKCHGKSDAPAFLSRQKAFLQLWLLLMKKSPDRSTWIFHFWA